jgi:VanZ family protein
MILKFHLYSILWAVFIALMSFYPGRELPRIDFWELLAFDKFMHISCYAVLLFLMINGTMKQYRFSTKRFKIGSSIFMLCFFYGILLETLQPVVMSDRIFDYFDIIANLIGCILGIFIYNFVYFKNEI